MRAKLPHTEGEIDRSGVKLHYEIYGEGAHTIVFVPTWALIHSRCWKAQVPYFSETHRVITYDPRGNGKSDRPDNDDEYSLDAIIDDVIAIMDATDTPKAILVGFSFSSTVSLAVAANHPERVEAVISTAGWTPLVGDPPDRINVYDQPAPDQPADWETFNREYWRTDFDSFAAFFQNELNSDPHSTKQFDDAMEWTRGTDGITLAKTIDARGATIIDEDTYRQVRCPCLFMVGDGDRITQPEASYLMARLTGGELHVFEGGGHGIHGRYPARVNMLMRDFLAKHFGPSRPTIRRRKNGVKRALYLSSPIGLGHARRDLAVARELRVLHPDLQIDWLAQDPVTRFLNANKQTIHPASWLLANESAHIEAECGEHDLHAFQAIRSMDEILIKNFMVFQEVLEDEAYDLVIADEAWDVDHYWHEHPEYKRA